MIETMTNYAAQIEQHVREFAGVVADVISETADSLNPLTPLNERVTQLEEQMVRVTDSLPAASKKKLDFESLGADIRAARGIEE